MDEETGLNPAVLTKCCRDPEFDSLALRHIPRA